MPPASAPAVSAASASMVPGGTTSPSSSSSQRSPLAAAVSFRVAPTPRLPLSSSKLQAMGCTLSTCSSRSCVVVAKSQPREVAGDPSKDSVIVDTKTEAPAEPSTNEASVAPLFDGDMSELLSQISSLVKLVDSRDIVELQLKQRGFELILRKKEALPQLPPPVIMMQSQGPPPVMQPQYAPPPIAASTSQLTAGTGTSQPPPSASPAKSSKSSFPPLKSPMAGTFYRSPGPGQAPFVKVGDKVKKGQVLCIIEAMKLMNEIEADQAGTVVDILVEDAKPVGVDQPLFVVEP